MKIIIRTDASNCIGSGHVMRCLVLAKALIKKQHKVTFVCRAQAGDLIEYIRQQSIDVLVLAPLSKPLLARHSADYTAWLQVPWQEDVQALLAQVDTATLVITDHYAIDEQWEKSIKKQLNCAIVAIDDLDRSHDTALIIDQNLWPDNAIRYQNCPGDKLLGPQYALLRPSFQRLRTQHIPQKNQVLAFFGGSDLTKECLKLATAARLIPQLVFTLKIVAGCNNLAYQELLAICDGTDIMVEKFIDDFDMELKTSNYVIGASGVSNWERFCLQIPASIVSVADNQQVLSKHLADLNAVRYLGNSEQTQVETYQEELRYLSANWSHLTPFKSICVDGLGVSRIIKKIEEVVPR